MPTIAAAAAAPGSSRHPTWAPGEVIRPHLERAVILELEFRLGLGGTRKGASCQQRAQERQPPLGPGPDHAVELCECGTRAMSRGAAGEEAAARGRGKHRDHGCQFIV